MHGQARWDTTLDDDLDSKRLHREADGESFQREEMRRTCEFRPREEPRRQSVDALSEAKNLDNKVGGIHTARSVVTIVCSLCCHHLSLQCSTNQKASLRLCSKQVFSTPRGESNRCSLHASRTSFAVVVPESLHTSPAASTLKNPCCGPMRSQEDRTTADECYMFWCNIYET